MKANEIKAGQEMTIAGETFRALRVSQLGVYFAKLLQNGELAAPNKGNHGTYTFEQIDNYVALGAMAY